MSLTLRPFLRNRAHYQVSEPGSSRPLSGLRDLTQRHAHQPKQEISQAQNATSPKAIKLTLLINSERTHRLIHRLTTLSRHCHRLSQTHSRTSDSAKCERLSARSHAPTIPALSKESCIEDMLSDFAEILMPRYAPASSFFISLY